MKKKSTTVTFPLPRAFSLSETVVSHGWYRLPPFAWDETSQTLHRTEVIDGTGAVDLSIRAGTRLTVSSSATLSPHRTELATKLNRMLQLDVDLEPFHSLCRKRTSHRLVAERGFGRLLCAPTLFEDAVKIILTTNTTWTQTVRMTTLFVDRLGTAAASGNRAFPTPDQVAASGEDVLRAECRLGYRAPYVLGLARGIVDGSLDLEHIADPAQSSEALFRSYRRLPGIGPYGAAHLLAMDGRHDYIAVDTEFRSFMRRTRFPDKDVSDTEMVSVYRRWGQWKYLAYWSELWMELAAKVSEAEKPE
jgi:3-methyladenine DNA glycosylase/8-oxoguanine DNA glycosylase